ncbi:MULTISPECIES: MFS transporter [unclassified Serratia (in: enterobacteria)]|uniref:MFS transporter n=1 Tax=unclassified Serratia (in: enterobacteria) TaxID=2647522 RepID=UPI002ED66C2D|nr:MFS transporter [Serratia sp. C2(2)]MEE4448988.1 MFS transporter [Serratia sp. C2(1)]
MNLLLLITALKAISEKIIYFVLPLWAFQLTQSNDLMSHVRLFEYLPFLVLGFVIGTLVDRIGSRKGFIGGTVGQIAVVILLAWNGVHSQHLLFLLVFMLMGMTYFANNALIVQSKVALPENRLITYNKYNNMVTNVFDSAGPAIIGGILLLLTYTQTLSLSYMLLFIALLLSLFSFRRTPPAESKPFIPDIIYGFKALYRLRNLWILSWWTSFANAIVVVSEIAVMYYAKSQLNLSDFQVGLLFAAGGIGAIIGSWCSDRVEKRFGVIQVLVYSIPLVGLTYILISIHINTVTLGILLFCESFLFSIYIVCVRTYRLVIAPAKDLGKINGITGSIFKMFIPFSLAAYGAWGSSISTNEVLRIMGGLFLIGSIILSASNMLKMKEKLSDNY